MSGHAKKAADFNLSMCVSLYFAAFSIRLCTGGTSCTCSAARADRIPGNSDCFAVGASSAIVGIHLDQNID